MRSLLEYLLMITIVGHNCWQPAIDDTAYQPVCSLYTPVKLSAVHYGVLIYCRAHEDISRDVQLCGSIIIKLIVTIAYSECRAVLA